MGIAGMGMGLMVWGRWVMGVSGGGDCGGEFEWTRGHVSRNLVSQGLFVVSVEFHEIKERTYCRELNFDTINPL